jgi:hypothetical protein
MYSKQNADNDEMIPLKFHLSQNYPNPFKEKTIIKYCIAYKAEVTITIFNSKGEVIERLLKEKQEAGTYEIEFDAGICHSGLSPQSDDESPNLSADRQGLPEGTYFYQLKVNIPETRLPADEAGSGLAFIETKKMILLR